MVHNFNSLVPYQKLPLSPSTAFDLKEDYTASALVGYEYAQWPLWDSSKSFTTLTAHI